MTDALLRTTTLSRDLAGRVTQQILPDTSVVGFGYDRNSNMSSLTPPGKPTHGMDYTPVDLLSSYAPPVVSGSGANNTGYIYDLDRMLQDVFRPDGLTVHRSYDSAGRLSTITLPTGLISYTYSPTTGKLVGLSGPDGETVSFGFDGRLLNDIAYAGPVAGNVHWTYNTDFRVSAETVNGANAASFAFDNDGLLTQAGGQTLTRNVQNGLLTGTALGGVVDSYTHDAFGAVQTYSASYGATALLSESYTRDALGRIATKTETVQGTTHVYEYSYDLVGRLTDVTVDGALSAHYSFDANGNRLTKASSAGTDVGTYDDQDRMLSYAGATYAYGANGELVSKTSAGQTTSYTSDVLGNLKRVALPGGPVIEYLVDGQGRRIGKKVNGALVRGYLWTDALRIAAELDGAGSLVSRFVYGTRGNVPEYMVRGADTYRLLTDHLGSVRLVVKVSDGSVAQRIDYV